MEGDQTDNLGELASAEVAASGHVSRLLRRRIDEEYGSDQGDAVELFLRHGTSAFRHGHSAEGFPPTADEIRNARPAR
jgi:hypothetical protein